MDNAEPIYDIRYFKGKWSFIKTITRTFVRTPRSYIESQ